MLRQMARHADQLLGELHRPLQMRVVQVEPGVARAVFGDLGLHAAPVVGGDRRAITSSLRPITLPTSRIADARAIVDDRRGNPGAVAAVFLVDVLDHLLAPLVLEVDVDVGRLLALLGDEALEQQLADSTGSTAVMPRQ